MILYDLSNTALASADEPVRPPTQAELLAITVALLTYENRSFSELCDSPVALSKRNCRRGVNAIPR